MTAETRKTLTHAAGVALMRVVEAGGGVMLITLIPRLMGPQVYGQFALLHSVSLWFSLLSGLGNTSVLTRYGPEFLERGDREGLTRLASVMLVWRGLGGLGATAAFLALAWIWLGDLDWRVILMMGISVGVRSVANLTYALSLGLNEAAKWGVSEMCRRGLLAPVSWIGFQWDGLRGAAAAFLLLEVFVLLLGLWWRRDCLDGKYLKVDLEYLRPYLKYGAGFVGATLLFTLYTRAGGPLVKVLSSRYEDVAQFSVAFGIYLTAAYAMVAVFQAMAPKFTTLELRGDKAALRRWTSRLLAISAVVGVAGAAGAWIHARPLAVWALGKQYADVGELMMLLGLAGLVMAPGLLGKVLVVSLGEWKVNLIASLQQLLMFVLLSAVMYPAWQVRGVAVAVVASTLANSLFMAWGLRESGVFGIGKWAMIVGLGMICAPLIWVWGLMGFLSVFGGGVAILAMRGGLE